MCICMNTYQIFIDGAAGTTGLQVQSRLEAQPDIDLIVLDEADRKNDAKRAEAMAVADVSILCLPDEAAKQAAATAKSLSARLIDASTAHRVDPGFVYGFTELLENGEDQIASAQFVSNPGCYPTGFLALVRPLIEAGWLSADNILHVPAISGYSGGGKAMISDYEAGNAPAYGSYGLNLAHKHLPEMKHHAGLSHAPLFLPSVGNFAQGMLVTVMLDKTHLLAAVSAENIKELYQRRYQSDRLISVGTENELTEKGFLAADALAGTDRLELFVFADSQNDRLVLTARLDNLGKGASGAAVQNLNLMLGRDALTGLCV
jgi:N-acetyl-gamma-glutamyl-phosphate reductase